MITASKLELAERCPGNLTLVHRDEPNEYSEAGTDQHAADEDAINAGNIPEAYEARWPGLAWQAEVSYAYDVSTDTSRFLGIGLKRAYGQLRPFEVAGTIDAEGRGPGVLVVVDRKRFDDVTAAAANPQVRFLALAAARTVPAEQIHVAINHELKGLDVAELDPVFDLDVIAHDTRQLLIRSAAVRDAARAGEVVPFNTGRWCRWCSAFNDCPKQRELRALMARDDNDPRIVGLTSFLDDEDAPDAYELWKRIGILHKRMGQTLYAHAASRPIRLRNGRVFGPHDVLGDREYDGPTVHAVIAARPDLGRDVADKCVEMVASQAQFERVVKPLVAKGQFAATKRAVFDAVERLGKMTRKKTTAIEEYEPGPRALAPGDD